jgi:hypothetical protein
MSESLIQKNVAQEISDIAALANSNCEGFAHRLYNSKVAFTAPTEANVVLIQIPQNSALIITAIDIKVLYNTADAALPGDFRSTFDLNPYGPYVAAGAVGQIRILINNLQYCATAFDIGVINAGILLVLDGSEDRSFALAVNPNQPAGKNLTLITRLNAYTVPQAVGTDLKKKQTQFLDATP